MALIGYTITVVAKQDNPYNVLPETDISIRKNSDSTLVNIYADEAGLIPIAQLGAKTDSNGRFTFYADASIGVLKAVWTNGGVIATEVLDQNDHSRLVNRNAAGAHDAIYSRGFANVDAMLAFSGLVVGQRYSTGGTTWEYLGGGNTIDKFAPVTDVYTNDVADSDVQTLLDNFTGHTIRLKSGVTSITQPLSIPQNTVLIGSGCEFIFSGDVEDSGSIIEYSGTGDAIRIGDSGNLASGITLKNFSVRDKLGTGRWGISIGDNTTASYYINMESVGVHGFDESWHFDRFFGGSFKQCYWRGGRSYGWRILSSPLGGMTFATFEACGGWNVTGTISGWFIERNTTYSFWDACFSEQGKIGWKITGDISGQSRLRNCGTELSTEWGFYLDNTNASFNLENPSILVAPSNLGTHNGLIYCNSRSLTLRDTTNGTVFDTAAAVTLNGNTEGYFTNVALSSRVDGTYYGDSIRILTGGFRTRIPMPCAEDTTSEKVIAYTGADAGDLFFDARGLSDITFTSTVSRFYPIITNQSFDGAELTIRGSSDEFKIGIDSGRFADYVGQGLFLGKGEFVKLKRDPSDGKWYLIDRSPDRFANAAPATGWHSRGQRYNIGNPSAGGFAQYVCVSNGNPGTWKTSGAITT